jgi:hypothetical protein
MHVFVFMFSLTLRLHVFRNPLDEIYPSSQSQK